MAAHRPPVVKLLDEVIEHAESKPAKLRRARALILEALTGDDRVPAPKLQPVSIAEGSLGHRLLDILREHKVPMKPAAIVKASKAPEWKVGLTLKELVADGHVEKYGATLNRTYAIARGGK